jgi:CheY-like chemotaxis protein
VPGATYVDVREDRTIFFTDLGEIGLSVSLAANEQDAGPTVTVVFTISDTGIGIPAERQATLFQAFSPGDQSTTRQHGGTGIGLALVKQLVDAMDGTITWQSSTSAERRGTVFTVRLPYTLPAPERLRQTPDQLVGRGDLWAPAPANGQRTGAPPTRRLLLVDENAVSRLISREMLSSLGFAVAEAGDIEQALAALDSGSFDVVLIDCPRPLADGFTIHRQLRARAIELGLPGAAIIIALAASAYAHDRAACLAAGFDACLSKPFNLKTLGTSIESALSRRQGASGLPLAG